MEGGYAEHGGTWRPFRVRAAAMGSSVLDVVLPGGELPLSGWCPASSEVDPEHPVGVDPGVDAGAPVLGGGWSLRRGRTGPPPRPADGRTVLLPTPDPAALRAAPRAARGTLDA